MNAKKSDKANLEKKRIIFLQVGFVVALSIVFFAFEWAGSGMASTTSYSGFPTELPPDIVIERTFRKPEPPKVQVAERLKITPDDEIITSEAVIESSETNESEKINIIELPPEEPDPGLWMIEETFIVVEEMPLFPGANNQDESNYMLRHFIAENVSYPDIARESGIEGKVFVEYTINKFGKVADVKIKRGVDAFLDKEALIVIKKLPRFKPGKQRGKAVNVRYVIPINFSLS